MKAPPLTVEDAVNVLRYLGSAEDPIWVGGIEIAPEKLTYEHALSRKDSRRFQIQFYGIRGRQLRKRRGTLFTMILDRLGVNL